MRRKATNARAAAQARAAAEYLLDFRNGIFRTKQFSPNIPQRCRLRAR
jgi:hypothetical protein